LTDAQITAYAVSGAVIAGFIIVAFVMLEMMRGSNKRKFALTKDGHERCWMEVVTKSGHVRKPVGEIVGLFVKDTETGAKYKLENAEFSYTTFPDAGPFKRYGAPVKKCYVQEGMSEPFYTKANSVISDDSTRIGYQTDTDFLAAGKTLDEAIRNENEKAEKLPSALVVYLLHGLEIAGIIATIYMIYVVMQKVYLLQAAMGV